MLKAKIIDLNSERSILKERLFLSKMNDPFIVNMLCSFQDKNHIYLVLQLLTGGDLRYHLTNYNYAFTETQLKFLLSNIVLGLNYIHSKRIIHRDLKPENIIFDDKGYAYITDFGIAWSRDEVHEGDFSGTPCYMAPESLFGLDQDFYVDFYSLGVIGYEIIMGKTPYEGNSRRDIKKQMQEKDILLENDEIEDYSDICVEFINKLLIKKSENRIGSESGISQIKDDIFFKGLNWDVIYRHKYLSPLLEIIKTARIKEGTEELFDLEYCQKDDSVTKTTLDRYEKIKNGRYYSKYFRNYSIMCVDNILKELPKRKKYKIIRKVNINNQNINNENLNNQNVNDQNFNNQNFGQNANNQNMVNQNVNNQNLNNYNINNNGNGQLDNINYNQAKHLIRSQSIDNIIYPKINPPNENKNYLYKNYARNADYNLLKYKNKNRNSSVIVHDKNKNSKDYFKLPYVRDKLMKIKNFHDHRENKIKEYHKNRENKMNKYYNNREKKINEYHRNLEKKINDYHINREKKIKGYFENKVLNYKKALNIMHSNYIEKEKRLKEKYKYNRNKKHRRIYVKDNRDDTYYENKTMEIIPIIDNNYNNNLNNNNIIQNEWNTSNFNNGINGAYQQNYNFNPNPNPICNCCSCNCTNQNNQFNYERFYDKLNKARDNFFVKYDGRGGDYEDDDDDDDEEYSEEDSDSSGDKTFYIPIDRGLYEQNLVERNNLAPRQIFRNNVRYITEGMDRPYIEVDEVTTSEDYMEDDETMKRPKIIYKKKFRPTKYDKSESEYTILKNSDYSKTKSISKSKSKSKSKSRVKSKSKQTKSEITKSKSKTKTKSKSKKSSKKKTVSKKSETTKKSSKKQSDKKSDKKGKKKSKKKEDEDEGEEEEEGEEEDGDNEGEEDEDGDGDNEEEEKEGEDDEEGEGEGDEDGEKDGEEGEEGEGDEDEKEEDDE